MSMITAFSAAIGGEGYTDQLFRSEDLLEQARQNMRTFLARHLGKPINGDTEHEVVLGEDQDALTNYELTFFALIDDITIAAEAFAQTMARGRGNMDPEADEFLSETIHERINSEGAEGIFVIKADEDLGFDDIDSITWEEIDRYVGIAEGLAASIVEEARCRRSLESLGAYSVPVSVQLPPISEGENQ